MENPKICTSWNKRWCRTFGGVIQNHAIILGDVRSSEGIGSSQPSALVLDLPHRTIDMSGITYNPTGAVSLKDTIMITNHGGNWSQSNFSEFFSLDLPSVKGPDLPEDVEFQLATQAPEPRQHTLNDASIIQANNTIYIIGGFMNDAVTAKTWIYEYNPDNYDPNSKPKFKL